MHPAPSVIFFTSFSGLGFGLLTFLGLGYPAPIGWIAFVFYAIGFALAVGGLVASTFHLGHPERALKAFTQWRTSWLSREGVVSVSALIVMGLHAALAIFFGVVIAPLGWIGAALCLLTVFCTAMIYAQLRTVPRWNQPLTPVLFLLYSLAGGALLAGHLSLAAWLLAALLIAQVAWWLLGDRRFAQAGSTIGSATGLGTRGRVRLLEAPHTSPNYLLKEMAFSVGRKHARRLRLLALLCVGLVPLALLVVLPPSHWSAGPALVLHVIGLLAARWLFFAEAEHVQALYYGLHDASA